MKTKVLYVLVSSDKDFFSEQTYLSISSLKIHNEEAKISLLIDSMTHKSLRSRKFDILKLVDELVVIDLPNEMSNKFKSRFLKTGMRNYISGDFLYIDSDTIVLSDLSEIDNLGCDMAAVYEFNRPFHENVGKNTLKEIYERLNQNIKLLTDYYNSGVIYVKDIDQTRSFFSEWQDEWKCHTEQGVFFDQPSLGIVNCRYGNYITPLNGEWNCQGRYSVNYIRTAKIFHYLYDKGFDFPLLNNNNFIDLKNEGVIPIYLKKVLTDPYSYISSNNLIITNEDVVLMSSKLYSIIRIIYGHPWLYSFFEKTINFFYFLFLKGHRRNLAPPR